MGLTALGAASILDGLQTTVPAGDLEHADRKTSTLFLRLHQVAPGDTPSDSNELTSTGSVGYHQSRVSGWSIDATLTSVNTRLITEGGEVFKIVDLESGIVSFPQARGDWEQITHWSLVSKLAGMLAWDEFTTPIQVSTGEVLSVASGDSKVSLRVD